MSLAGPHKYDPRAEPNATWDVVANTTLTAANNNSTLLGLGSASSIEMTPTDMMYYALSIMGLILFCFCTRSRIPDERYRQAAAERRARFLEQQARRERLKEPEYRAQVVKKALVVKRVVEEKDGQLTLGDMEEDDSDSDDDLSSGGGSLSIDSTDENISTCVVCLEAFRVGDVVAWSRTRLQDPEAATCNHVFHKDCIVSWLSQPTHDDCPSCRTVIVRLENEDDEEEWDDEFSTDGEGYATSAFIIMHGLVSRVRRASYSLIGQSIDLRDEDLDLDTSDRSRAPKVPPSPMRRVVSLENTRQNHHRRRSSSNLRRRPSDRSVSSQSSPLVDDSDGDMSDHSERSRQSLRGHLSPQMLRRVVSDFAQAPLAPLTRASSAGQRAERTSLVGRRMPLPLPPRRHRGHDYQSVSSHASDNSIQSYDMSEQSLEEEEQIIVPRTGSDEISENGVSSQSGSEAT